MATFAGCEGLWPDEDVPPPRFITPPATHTARCWPQTALSFRGILIAQSEIAENLISRIIRCLSNRFNDQYSSNKDNHIRLR